MLFRAIVAAVAVLLVPALARADMVRFRFMPAGATGAMTQVPTGPDGTLGELRAWRGGTPRPFPSNFVANRMVTFRHPYTSRNVIVPMKMPNNVPRVDRISERIRFNYGAYYVEARFLPDGGVDVIYNTGIFSGLPRD